jgi:hypothetical protein
MREQLYQLRHTAALSKTMIIVALNKQGYMEKGAFSTPFSLLPVPVPLRSPPLVSTQAPGWKALSQGGWVGETGVTEPGQLCVMLGLETRVEPMTMIVSCNARLGAGVLEIINLVATSVVLS